MKSPFLRDEFAKNAMQALITASVIAPGEVASAESIANLAYIFADAMLIQREKETVDNRKKDKEDGLV